MRLTIILLLFITFNAFAENFTVISVVENLAVIKGDVSGLKPDQTLFIEGNTKQKAVVESVHADTAVIKHDGSLNIKDVLSDGKAGLVENEIRPNRNLKEEPLPTEGEKEDNDEDEDEAEDDKKDIKREVKVEPKEESTENSADLLKMNYRPSKGSLLFTIVGSTALFTKTHIQDKSSGQFVSDTTTRQFIIGFKLEYALMKRLTIGMDEDFLILKRDAVTLGTTDKVTNFNSTGLSNPKLNATIRLLEHAQITDDLTLSIKPKIQKKKEASASSGERGNFSDTATIYSFKNELVFKLNEKLDLGFGFGITHSKVGKIENNGTTSSAVTDSTTLFSTSIQSRHYFKKSYVNPKLVINRKHDEVSRYSNGNNVTEEYPTNLVAGIEGGMFSPDRNALWFLGMTYTRYTLTRLQSGLASLEYEVNKKGIDLIFGVRMQY